jgi:hypothetical protein
VVVVPVVLEEAARLRAATKRDMEMPGAVVHKKKDARFTHKGSYGGWLWKVKQDGAMAKWLASSVRRFFTIDFERRTLAYSQCADPRGVEDYFTAIPFSAIISADRPEESGWGVKVPKSGGLRRSLSGVLLGASNLPPPRECQYTFTVTTKRKNFTLLASSDQDAFAWVQAINQAHVIGLGAPSTDGSAGYASPTILSPSASDSQGELVTKPLSPSGSMSTSAASERDCESTISDGYAEAVCMSGRSDSFDYEDQNELQRAVLPRARQGDTVVADATVFDVCLDFVDRDCEDLAAAAQHAEPLHQLSHSDRLLAAMAVPPTTTTTTATVPPPTTCVGGGSDEQRATSSSPSSLRAADFGFDFEDDGIAANEAVQTPCGHAEMTIGESPSASSAVRTIPERERVAEAFGLPIAVEAAEIYANNKEQPIEAADRDGAAASARIAADLSLLKLTSTALQPEVDSSPTRLLRVKSEALYAEMEEQFADDERVARIKKDLMLLQTQVAVPC